MSSRPTTIDAQYYPTRRLRSSFALGNGNNATGTKNPKTAAANPSPPPTTSNGTTGSHGDPVTASHYGRLTAAALAQQNANRDATILAERQAASARVDAMQRAARTMNFEVPQENPWTGTRIGEDWCHHQARTNGPFVGPW